MLELVNIKKTYYSKSGNVEALHGISIKFPDSQFVSILGHSGCGKTTLLNIIGGLDKYTEGDYLINGVSTKEYLELDWNTFRNHSVGFVFQSYNLIPHQTVLSNVEMALTLAGINKEERRKRAIEALERVGLKDQVYKKPNQLSGGQAQRVAIARAIVNKPDIILADEPTGALDSETSIQVMDILKELSKTTLVVMVTHNPDLANKYSDRIIKLKDGLITEDKIVNNNEEVMIEKEKKTNKHSSMNIFTAFFLSLTNLLSKKSRTILTAIAGSIGIIGVSLILALSTGFKSYIDKVQKDSLSSYPLIVSDASIDLSSIIDYRPADLDKYPVVEKLYVNQIVQLLKSTIQKNNIDDDYINNVINKIPKDLIQAISYSYPTYLNIFKDNYHVNEDKTTTLRADKVSEVNVAGVGGLFSELLDDKDFVLSQYDVIYGKYPENYNEVILVVDEYNQLTDYVLNMLHIDNSIYNSNSDGTVTIDFKTLMDITFKFVPNNVLFEVEDGETKVNALKLENNNYYIDIDKYNDPLCEEIKIVGVMRLNPNTTTGIVSQASAIAYLPSLGEHVYNVNKDSDLVNLYLTKYDELCTVYGKSSVDGILDAYGGTRVPEQINIYPSSFNAKEQIKDYLDDKNNEVYTNSMNEYYLEKGMEYCLEQSITLTGTEDEINKQYIEYGKLYHGTETEFNEAIELAKSKMVKYTDIMSLIISSVSTIIDAITYVLIAFTSISLIVSSIMIGVITYISVIERTKEIGILRALGARRKDVFRIFNAETFLIGLTSGIIGVIVTSLLCIPINAILNNLAGIGNVAYLQPLHALIIIGISFTLTVISGLIPSKKATKIDPVIALRTE